MKSRPALKVITRTGYVPALSDLERRAYLAAHRIVTTDFSTRELACPGGRRSRQVDRIAEILMESFRESK